MAFALLTEAQNQQKARRVVRRRGRQRLNRQVLGFAPAPAPAVRFAPSAPIQVIELQPNSINFGEYPTDQVVQVRQQPINFAPAPVAAPVPVRIPQPNLVPAPVAAPLPVQAPLPVVR